MLNINIPEFDYRFFDASKSNVAIAKITHHESEIVPMIYDYLDYHADKPGIREIIELLHALRSYLFGLELLDENKITQDRFLEIETKLIDAFDVVNRKHHDATLTDPDKVLLTDAKDYTKKVIANKMNDLSLNDDNLTFVKSSKLSKTLQSL